MLHYMSQYGLEAAACLSLQSGGKEVVLRRLYEEGCSPVHGALSPGTGGLHTHSTAIVFSVHRQVAYTLPVQLTVFSAHEQVACTLTV